MSWCCSFQMQLSYKHGAIVQWALQSCVLKRETAWQIALSLSEGNQNSVVRVYSSHCRPHMILRAIVEVEVVIHMRVNNSRVRNDFHVLLHHVRDLRFLAVPGVDQDSVIRLIFPVLRTTTIKGAGANVLSRRATTTATYLLGTMVLLNPSKRSFANLIPPNYHAVVTKSLVSDHLTDSKLHAAWSWWSWGNWSYEKHCNVCVAEVNCCGS